MDNQKNNKTDILLAEYTASHDAFIHQDNFAWQVGSILIASSLIFWGLIFEQEKPKEPHLIFSSWIEIALMSIWILYAHHNRQIYLWKLRRIREIESSLGMKSNLNWVEKNQKNKFIYRVFPPKGNMLNLAIYVLISIGSVVIPWIEFGFKCWQIFATGLIILVTIIVLINEIRIKKLVQEK